MIEGSGSGAGSIPLTNGSGSRRPETYGSYGSATVELYMVAQNKRRNRAKQSEKAKSQNGEIATNHKGLWLLQTVVT